MRIGVPRESVAGENRVALTPAAVTPLKKSGLEVVVEHDAGTAAGFTDAAYEQAGASMASRADVFATGDIILQVRAIPAETSKLRRGQIVIGFADPLGSPDAIRKLADAGATAFSMELMPRITRAQSMDALSSMGTIAGYKGVLLAANHLPRMFPMLMTAAGTLTAARVFIVGAGVAGLQAIATARRLGAVVTATDVRPAAKEQVESLGAKFIAVEDEEFKQAETAAGYAKEMSKEYQAKQAALVAEHVKKQDVVITTALIPGRPAPRLISADMVRSMKPGSVIVDLAVERGGNVEGVKAGGVADVNGVKIVGYNNVPGRLAASSSGLYARNLFAFLEILVDKKAKALNVNWDDEIVKATALTRDGAVIHPNFKPKSAA